MISKNSNLQIKLGTILRYINYVVKMLVQLLYIPIMLKLLGKSEYGVYQLVGSLISSLSLLSFGFDGAYLRFYSQCRQNRKREASLNGTFLIVFLVFALASLLIGIFMTIHSHMILGTKLTNNEQNLAQILLAILTFNMFLTFPISVFTSIIISRENFIFLGLIDFGKTILNPFLVVSLLLLGYGSVGLVMVTTILTIAGGGISIWYVFSKIKAPFSFRNFDFQLVKEISHFSLFIFLNSIIDQINWNVDKYILARLVGASSIAIYSVGLQINNIYIQLTDMLASVLAPRINKIVATAYNPLTELNALFIKVGRLQAYVVMIVLSGFIIYGKEFIFLWVGNGYQGAYYITLCLIIPVSIPLCQTLGVDIQRALNKHQYRAVVYSFIVLVNVIITIPLTIKYGVIGPAIGTGISLIIGNGIAMNILYHKVIGLNIYNFWFNVIKVTPAIILPAIISITIKYFIPITSIVILVGEILLFCIIYMIFVYCLTMNDDEKLLIQNFLK